MSKLMNRRGNDSSGGATRPSPGAPVARLSSRGAPPSPARGEGCLSRRAAGGAEAGLQVLEFVQQRREAGAFLSGNLRLRRARGLDGRPLFSRQRSRQADAAAAELEHITRPAVLEDFLHALDGQSVAVKKRADALQKIDIFGPVITPAPAPLQRPDRAEARIRKAQHVLRQC